MAKKAKAKPDVKHIVITYNPQTCNGGEGDEDGGDFDLYGYLYNEFMNHDIRCRIQEASPPTSRRDSIDSQERAVILDALKRLSKNGGTDLLPPEGLKALIGKIELESIVHNEILASEEHIVEYYEDRLENDALSIANDDLPKLLARVGLMDPVQFQVEIAERRRELDMDDSLITREK